MAVYVVDLETTGLDYERHRIIEVALYELDENFGVKSMYYTRVKPDDGEVDEEALKVNGFTLADLDNGMPEDMVVRELASRLLPDATIIAHHAPFDISFLQALFKRHGYPEWTGDFICTRSSFAVFFPDKPRSLHNVAEHFGVEIHGRHSAFGDARAVIAVYKNLAELARERGVDLTNLLVRDPDRPLQYVPAKARFHDEERRKHLKEIIRISEELGLYDEDESD